MPYRTEMLCSMIRPLLAIAGTGVCWLAQAATVGVEAIPAWVDKYGLPVVFLALTVYAIRALFMINQGLQAGANALTRELLTATDKQTAAIEKLATELHTRPCQVPGAFPVPRQL